jgi:hypothetical protein
MKGTLVRPIAKTSALELADAMLERASTFSRLRHRVVATVLKEVCIVSQDFESAMKFRELEKHGKALLRQEATAGDSAKRNRRRT